MRLCITCGEVLEIPDNHSESMARLKNWRCKPCYARRQKMHNAPYRAKTRAEARQATRAWREANPEKYEAQLLKAREKRNTSLDEGSV